jgi:hypothetical protein
VEPAAGRKGKEMSKQLILAMAVLVCVSTMVAPAAGQVLVPPPPQLVTSPIVAVNNGPGDQTDPHVNGDLATYTDAVSVPRIRYYRFSTATDAVVPQGLPGDRDILSDVSGQRIVFSRIEADRTANFVFDTATSTLSEIDPKAGSLRFSPVIGNTTVAYSDCVIPLPTCVGFAVFALDLSGGGPVQLSSGTGAAGNLNVAPSGDVVVWEQCSVTTAVCDVMKSVRSGGTWSAPMLVANSSTNPDTDGTWIVYDSDRPSASGQDIYFQPVAGGPEGQLAISGIQRNPSISQGVISYEGRTTAFSSADIFVYALATSTLYQVTSTPTVDDTLNDVSVLPNGDIRVVWTANDGLAGDQNVYATTFTPASPGGDFTFGAIAPITITAGTSASTTVAVNPVNAFSAAVNLTVFGQPAGVVASLSPNSVSPSGGNSASSVLNVILPSFIVPANFALTVTGASGSLSHSAAANVTVTATPSSTSNLIGDLVNARCIDNAGIANALTSKLSAAQSAANVQTAINTLTALKNQIQAQTGKHIAMSCAIDGVAFNPVTVLLLDVQGLIDSLKVSLIPDPITGYVVNSMGVGVPGATVSILNAAANTVATATADITGFYFLATTGVLTPGAYTIAVTGFPAGFASSAPMNQAFTWQGTAIALNTFVLN